MMHWLTGSAGLSGLWLSAMQRACWQGGLALVLAWTACRVFPGMPARGRCWLWRLAYLKLLVTLLWAVPLELPVLSAPPAAGLPLRAASAAPDIQSAAGAASVGAIDLLGPIRSAQTDLNWPAILLCLWLAGVSAGVLRLLAQWRSARRLRCASSEVDAAHVAELKTLCRGCGVRRPPQLLVADHIASPLLLGIFHPAIILPRSCLSNCNRPQLRLILSHELAHLARRDLLWDCLANSVHMLFFFHPLIWLSRTQWRLAREIACDERVIAAAGGSAGEYARTILNIAAGAKTEMTLAMGVGVVESFKMLERRFRAMKHYNTCSRKQLVLLVAALAMAGIFGLIPWRVVAQQPAPVRISPPAIAAADAAAEAAPAPLPRVTMRGVENAQMIGSLSAATAQIKAPQDGIIAGVAVKEGDRVKAGDVLIRLDDRKAMAALQVAQATLASAESNFRRLEGLGMQGNVARGELEQARAELDIARARFTSAKHDIEDAQIRAPFAGVVAACDASNGQVVSRGADLAKLVATDALKVEFHAPESLLPRLRTGQKVTITVAAYPDEQFNGEVRFIAPEVDRGSDTVSVKAQLLKQDERLMPGMFARVKLELGQ